MKSLRTAVITVGIAMAAASGMAQAGDIYAKQPADDLYLKRPTPEPPYIEPLPPMELRGGIYVRGFVGMTNQRLGKLDFIELHDPEFSFTFLDKGGFDSGPLFGAGIGYTFNEWFRMDVTGEYRGKVAFTALDHASNSLDEEWVNEYSARKSEWLFLVNAYLDLGTWKGLTPYVGAGIGASRNTISHFRDFNPDTVGGGGPALWYAPSHSKWNLAWALHAGLGFQVTDQLTIDLAYRYVNLGDARTGTVFDSAGFSEPMTPIHFKRLSSHDVMLGLRWNFGHGHYQEPLYDFPVMARN